MLGMSLPRPYPDELVGSVLARAVVHTGLPPKRLLLRVLGPGRTCQSMLLPACLQTLADATRVPSKELLWSHTVFPFAVAFLASDTVRALESRLLGAADSVSRSHGALLRSSACGSPMLRYCALCAQEDLDRHGESYWHRSHCLPLVHICPDHGVPLGMLPCAHRTLSRILLAPLPHQMPEGVERTSCPASVHRPLARATMRLLEAGWTRHDNWITGLRARAIAHGYALPRDRVAGLRLAHDLVRLFGPAYLNELGCPISDCAKGWPSLMVRERIGVTFSPVKHVLLEVFLSDVRTVDPVFAYPAPGPRPADLHDLDRVLAAKVMTEAARLIGCKVTATVRDVMASTGHLGTFKHRRKDLPLTCHELEHFKASEASQRKTGGRKVHAARMAAIAAGRRRPLPAWAGRRQRTATPPEWKQAG